MIQAGDGINLYFKLLKWVSGIFSLMFFVSLPSMVAYFSGEAQEKLIPSDERWQSSIT